MPESLRVRDWVLVTMIKIKYMLRLFIASMLYYILEEGEMEPNDNLF